MGYATYYTLETEYIPDEKAFAKDFEKITNFSLEALEEDCMKWYDWADDMLAISKLYPDSILTLYGDGEESDDEWKAVFCNGAYKQILPEKIWPDLDIPSIGGIGERHPEYFI